MAHAVDEEQSAQEPAALNIEDDHVKHDEEEEWEYEYSTTETETYYLTLELSFPEFKDQQTKTVHHSRGGYYKNWLDQHSVGWRHAADRDDNDEDDNNNDAEDDDEPVPQAVPDDGDAPYLDPELREGAKGKEKETRPGVAAETTAATQQDGTQAEENIQILELHSKHPVISYKGRLFEGSWAEVIGTEAIFANHDENNPLPALRRLAGNVDLLAASASRILTKEKVLKPQEPKEDRLEPIRDEWNIHIPVGKDRSGEKRQQASFLENLIALKKKKGETDHVTVYARDGKGKDFLDNRDPDWRPRRRKRLLDENGKEVIPKRLKPQRGGGLKSMGRPRKPYLQTGRTLSREEGEPGSASGEEEEEEEEALSASGEEEEPPGASDGDEEMRIESNGEEEPRGTSVREELHSAPDREEELGRAGNQVSISRSNRPWMDIVLGNYDDSEEDEWIEESDDEGESSVGEEQ